MDFFFLWNSVNSLISICLSDFRPKTTGIFNKTEIDDNRPKILLARWAHKWSRQLACSNYSPNRAFRTSAMSKPDTCEIISKSDSGF